MSEEVIWEGKVRLVRIKEGKDEILRWDDEELYNGLKVAFKRMKHEYSPNMVNALIFGLVGMLEEFKLHLLLLKEEV
jgi:hypothetical protein